MSVLIVGVVFCVRAGNGVALAGDLVGNDEAKLLQSELGPASPAPASTQRGDGAAGKTGREPVFGWDRAETRDQIQEFRKNVDTVIAEKKRVSVSLRAVS